MNAGQENNARRIASMPIWLRLTGVIWLMMVLAFGSMIVWETRVNHDTAIDQARDFAGAVNEMTMAGLTGMMITGTVAQRDVFLDQIKELSVVRDLEVIRGEAVTKVFGDGGVPAAPVDALAAQGRTLVAVAVDGQWAGLIGVADPLRASSVAAVARLQAAGIDVVMLTGDHPATARAVASAVGIARVDAQVLPDGKAAAVAALASDRGLVGMAGDGINDAPALAAADVSFAMGGGADVALEAADITLVRGDLNGVADAVALSRATLSKIRQIGRAHV